MLDSLYFGGSKHTHNRERMFFFFIFEKIQFPSVRVCHHHLVGQKFVSSILMSGWCVYTRVCPPTGIRFVYKSLNRMSCRIDVSVIPRRPKSRFTSSPQLFPHRDTISSAYYFLHKIIIYFFHVMHFWKKVIYLQGVNRKLLKIEWTFEMVATTLGLSWERQLMVCIKISQLKLSGTPAGGSTKPGADQSWRNPARPCLLRHRLPRPHRGTGHRNQRFILTNKSYP